MRTKVLMTIVVMAAACGPAPASAPAPQPPPDLSGSSEPGARVWVDRQADEVVFVAGPFHVPVFEPGSGPEEGHEAHGREVATGHEGHQRTPVLEFLWPETGWFQGFRLTLFDAQENRIDRQVLHHLIAVNFDRRQLVYPVAERLIGIGQETGDVVLPDNVGVPVESGTRLGVYASWRNETGDDLDGVYIRIAMPFTARTPGARVESVFPFYADTNNRIGDTNAWDLPPGRAERDFEFRIPLAGGLLAASGHLHDHGKELRLEDARRDRVLFTLRGVESAPGKLEEVETKVFRRFFGLIDDRVELEAGRPYRVVGVYDNATDRTIELGAMAHVVGLFAPEDPEAWPPVDRDSPEWQADIAALGDARFEMVGDNP